MALKGNILNENDELQKRHEPLSVEDSEKETQRMELTPPINTYVEKSKISSLLRPPNLSFDFTKTSTNKIENVLTSPVNSSDVKLTQLMDTINRVLQQNTLLLQNSLNSNDNNMSVQFISDAMSSVGNFDNCAQPVEARIWLESIENSARIFLRLENYTFDVACRHLKGAAHNCLIHKKSTFHSWSDFEIAFKTSFIPKHDKAELWSRKRDRK